MGATVRKIALEPVCQLPTPMVVAPVTHPVISIVAIIAMKVVNGGATTPANQLVKGQIPNSEGVCQL